MSMTGGGGSPKKHTVGKWYSPQIAAGSTLTVKLGVAQPVLGGLSDVAGFSETTLERRVVADLPTDVFIPAEVLDTVYAAKRLDLWIETGRRVQHWAEEQGIPDASWLADSTEGIRAPGAVPDADVPPFVRRWLDDAPEMEAIIADLTGLA